MTFLESACSKTLLKLQKSHLAYEKNCMAFRIQVVSKNMAQVSDYYDSLDQSSANQLEKDPYYKDLQRLSEYYEMKLEDIEQEMDLLDNEISAMQTLVKDGIKSSCGLTLSGGG